MSGLIQRRLQTPLPQTMRTLPRDARGYPIPFIVMRDKTGTPMFTINDARRTADCRAKHLCAVCGKKLLRHPISQRYEMWFVGGSRCFLHEHGAFLDPPVHMACAEYALRVCPFLTASRWTDRIDDKKLNKANMPTGLTVISAEYMPPALPERFGLGKVYDYQYITTGPGTGIYKVDTWAYVEFWQAGIPCPPPDTGIAPSLPI